MNEHGLFFDAARTPYQELSHERGRTYSGYLWQAMLDRCKSVDEALAFVGQYDIPELEEAHIIIADASGQCALLGVKDGKMAVRRSGPGVMIQTNFNPWNPELSDEPVCRRYELAKRMSAGGGGSVDVPDVLRSTHQDSLTVYSNVYNLTERKVVTYRQRHFDRPLTIVMPDVFARGECMVPLEALERGEEGWNECRPLPPRTLIVGRVVDRSSGDGVPYVNIGIPGEDVGTLSDPDGSFEIELSEEEIQKELHFSSIGYEALAFPVSQLRTGANVKLRPTSKVLDEVVIREKRGYKSARLGWMGGKDGVLPLDTVQGGGAVALLLEAPQAPVFVEKLQVRLMYNSKDTAVFRLHFYEYDSTADSPGRELLSKEVLLRGTKRFDWLRFDLREHEITLPHRKFFVGFEWIDSEAERRAMITGLKKWEAWKAEQHTAGSPRVSVVTDDSGQRRYTYHGNMMDWPGFRELPPFTGLMVETGKLEKSQTLRTFERKTSFGRWNELNSTLNAVVTVSY
jgi:hypothetical protein